LPLHRLKTSLNACLPDSPPFDGVRLDPTRRGPTIPRRATCTALIAGDGAGARTKGPPATAGGASPILDR